MSGGRFDYKDSALRTEIFGWGDKFTNVFEDREISELVWDVLDLVHDFDWYKSGDTCEETWLKKKKEFKQKWFDTLRKDRIKSIVNKAFEESKNELYKTFNIEEFQENSINKDAEDIPELSWYAISEITIPSVEDVRNLEKDILKKGEWWWLRSPGYNQNFSASVRDNGDILEYGYYVDDDSTGIRPCFSIPRLRLTKGDKVFVENTLCTVIADNLVLADNLICYHMFDEVDNDWTTSSLKQFIESKEFSEMIIRGEHI